MTAADGAVWRYCPRCASALVQQAHGGRPRAACPACGWVHWDNPLPVVAALIEQDGRVLLARNAAWPPKMFALVTGFLEAGETPEQAVAREVLEETGLIVQSSHWIGAYAFERKNELILAWHVQTSGVVTLGDELAEVRWIEPARLRPWPLGTGHAVADWLRARGLPVEFLASPA